jgi:1-acyl-sn-glycerol-3-phosphate acyltransferase
MRTVVWFFCFGIYMIGTIFKTIPLAVLKKRGKLKEAESFVHNAAKHWAKYCIKSARAEIEVIGKENLPQGACLFVGNHQGYLDIPVVLSEFDRPIGFVAKKELLKAPILSMWMKEIHCVFMDRENVREAMKSINEAADFLRQGYSMVIFPEGTRSKGKKLREFKKGSLKLGIKAEVPIVPITISGTYKVFEEKNRIRTAKVKVIVDKPIDVKTLSKEQQNNLTEIIKAQIEKNLEEI